VKLGKSATETLELLHEAFGELLDSSFWMAFTFQGRSSVSWRWWMFRVTNHQQNNRKCWKLSRTHSQRLPPNNPWARRHYWDQLWSLPGDLNRKFEHVCSLTLDKWSKAVGRKHMSSAKREGWWGPNFYP
jgi:hypothetical protein